MIVIPIHSPNPDGEDLLLIVLKTENVERMAKADPAQIHWSKFPSPRVKEPVICICYEPDWIEVDKFVKAKDINGLRKYLSRGFQYKPECGDSDEPPKPYVPK